MRLLHTSDWHLGRSFHGASLLEEQAAALARIGELAREAEVDAVVIEDLPSEQHLKVGAGEEEALLGDGEALLEELRLSSAEEAVGEVRAEISKSKGYKKKKRRVSKEDRKKKEGGGVGGGVGVGGGEPRCGVCGEVFGSRSRLFAHLREHPDHAVLKGRR